MRKHRRRHCCRVSGFLSLLAGLVATTALPATALGPAFTYQGQLTQSGVPAAGSCDVRFSLFDALIGGAQIGSAQTFTNVALNNGVFTAQLNPTNEFGITAFSSGADRFLEMAIRCPTGVGSFNTLTPRQMVIATPYAQFAAAVGSNAVVSGNIVDGTIATADLATDAVTSAKIADGTVGSADVGFNYAASTSKGGPASDLTCSACVANGELSATGSNSGQVLTSNGSSVAWQNQSGFTLPVNASGANSNAATMRIENTASGGTGLLGMGLATGVSGVTSNGDYGVRGETGQTAGYGVYGVATGSAGSGVAGNGTARGVLGSSTSGTGVTGESTNAVGVRGTGATVGMLGTGVVAGVQGNSALGKGVIGAGVTGVEGTSQLGSGVVGSSSSGVGVDGSSANSYGVRAQSFQTALYARNDNGNSASLGTPTLAGDFNGHVAVSDGITALAQYIGVSGEATGGFLGVGVTGTANNVPGSGTGVVGLGGATGVRGLGAVGVYAESTADATKWATLGDGTMGLGGVFNGGVRINGGLTTFGSKNFQIDHPFDPENRYLVHAAIESAETMNVYSGNVVLDDDGTASVDLPAWFAAININYRYQLTAIGAPAPNLHVAKKIENGRFEIGGGTPGLEVSWQVAATRNDAYAIAHPFEVERYKTPAEKEHDRVTRGQ